MPPVRCAGDDRRARLFRQFRQRGDAADITGGGAPCGQSTTQALAATDGKVAERIYRDELGGPATGNDRHQVETYAPLLDALAEGNLAPVCTSCA